jgi:hypothetical protein
MKIRAQLYQQFDADHARDVPAESYGGWKSVDIEINPERTAVVSMHAWDCGTADRFPGWWRAVEYIPRSHEICRTVYPPLLKAVRESPLHLMHVVSDQDYYAEYPGYKRAVELAGPDPDPPEYARGDDELGKLWSLKGEQSFTGTHNADDIKRGAAAMGFPEEARPEGSEGIAKNTEQLFALCKDAQVNHLVYIGFAINWCLLNSPGGMVDMSRRGFMCSTIREAVTAVENKATAREEQCKEIALWRVAVAFGFVFELDNFLAGIDAPRP